MSATHFSCFTKNNQAPGIVADPPQGKRTVLLVRTAQELRKHVSAWEQLAAAAIEPNVFYEPFFLLPAIESLRGNVELEFVLVYASRHDNLQDPPVLCGFFPLQRHRRYSTVPVQYVRLWRYAYCYLSTPLVRTDGAIETLTAFLDWLGVSAEGSPLLQFNAVTDEGAFNQILVETLRRRSTVAWVSRRFSRAMLRPMASLETYERTVLSAGLRKKRRRNAKRLAELGQVEYTRLLPDENFEAWIEEFLQLEASGWKGRQQTAMGSKPASKAFLLQVAREAYRRDRLFMTSLRLNGKPLAMNCDFLGGGGCFSFKTAYDEEFAKYTPGILLDSANLARFHESASIQWVDSCVDPCADPNHTVVNRIWNSRRALQSLWISPGHWSADVAVSLMPLVNRFKQVISATLGL